MDTVSRRLELLKLEGIGFNRSEIMKQLSEKYHCSERTLYFDFETRGDWQTVLQEIGDSQSILLKTVNVLSRFIVRLASGFSRELKKLLSLGL